MLSISPKCHVHGWRSSPRSRTIGSWWLLRKGESLSFGDVSPGGFPTTWWMAPQPWTRVINGNKNNSKWGMKLEGRWGGEHMGEVEGGSRGRVWSKYILQIYEFSENKFKKIIKKYHPQTCLFCGLGCPLVTCPKSELASQTRSQRGPGH